MHPIKFHPIRYDVPSPQLLLNVKAGLHILARIEILNSAGRGHGE